MLGTTHADVVKLFQSVPIGQGVTLVLCRGYPLPYEPPEEAANSNNNTAAAAAAILSPLGIMEQRPVVLNGRSGYDGYLDYLSRTARFAGDPAGTEQQTLLAAHPGDTHLDGSMQGPPGTGATPPDSVSMASSGAAQAELLTLSMVKGADGFGFTIADTPTGQRVKQVLEPLGCPGLCEGDLIMEVNKQPVQALTHAQVVELLKECSIGAEVCLVVQRGGAGETVTSSSSSPPPPPSFSSPSSYYFCSSSAFHSFTTAVYKLIEKQRNTLKQDESLQNNSKSYKVLQAEWTQVLSGRIKKYIYINQAIFYTFDSIMRPQ